MNRSDTGKEKRLRILKTSAEGEDSMKKLLCWLFGHNMKIAMGVNCKTFDDCCTHYVCDTCGKKEITRKKWRTR